MFHYLKDHLNGYEISDFYAGLEHSQKLLAALPQSNKYIRAGNESEERMVRMLFSERFDVWLEYPTVMALYISNVIYRLKP